MKKRLTIKNIAEIIYRDTKINNISEKEIINILNKFRDTIISEMEKWNIIQITWFWSFSLFRKKIRLWINPRNWEVITIPSRFWVKFKRSLSYNKKLKQLNELKQ